MSFNLIAVSAAGGIPLFCRQKSVTSSEGIAFVKMASLNSVNLFSRLNETNLQMVTTKDSVIHWKLYKGSIVLIMVATVDSTTPFTEINKLQIEPILDLIFDMIGSVTGFHKLTETNTENLKASLRLSFSVVDFILDLLFSGNRLPLILNGVEHPHTGTWTHPFMETLIETAARLASSQFCCLMVRKRLVFATKHWWSKISPTKDQLIIVNLVNSFNLNDNQTFREMNIYLPTNSPAQPVRLIAFLISYRVVIVFLCAEQPSMKHLHEHIIEPLISSQKDQEMLQKIVHENRLAPQIDENIITLIIFRIDRNTFTIVGSLDLEKQRDLIRLMEIYNSSSICNNHSQSEFYANFRRYKGYLCTTINLKLLCLFSIDKSLAIMRKIANKTLNILSKERRFFQTTN